MSFSAFAVKGAPRGNADSEPRAKHYQMCEDGTWEDQGSGYVTVEKVEESSEDMGLFFINDKDNEELLLHWIGPDDIYEKKEDTNSITWKDPAFGTHLSLNFEDTAGCSNIWSRIHKVRMTLHVIETLNNNNTDETLHEVDNNLKVLPAVELSTLPLILKTVAEWDLFDQIRLIELIMDKQNLLKKLMELFRICEDLENIDGLHMIFRIVKAIILLNSHEIFKLLFDDELAMDIIGCLEYDPEVANVQRHRDFLKTNVLFEEAIPIKDPLTLSKMHQTFRLGYLKETILRTQLDEETVGTIDNIVLVNSTKVISLLKEDNKFFQELFARLRSFTTSVESKKNLVCFLHEYCKLIKSIATTSQLPLFRDLMNEGIFDDDIMAGVLQNPDKRVVQTGIDIIACFLRQDPNLLRTYFQEQKGRPLLGLLVKGFTTDIGDGIHCQFLEMLYALLDVAPSSGPQGKPMIDIFCEKHLSELIDVITSACPMEGAAQSVVSKAVVSGGRVENQNNVKPEILLNICELICFCVERYPVTIKCYFLCNNAINRVLFLTRRKENYLVVASVRFMRIILFCGDSILIAHIIKKNLLKPVVLAFLANGNRYNLLQSAILELFEFFYKENMCSLVTYLIHTFWDKLVQFEYLSSIHTLKAKYDKYLAEDAEIEVLESQNSDMEGDYSLDKGCDEEDTASSSISNKNQCQTGLSHGGSTSHPSSSGPRCGGLIDHDVDGSKDYPPSPPMKPSKSSNGDEVMLESITMKRHSDSTEKDFVETKKQCQDFTPDANVSAGSCPTLSQTVPPATTNETLSTMHDLPTQAGDKNSG